MKKILLSCFLAASYFSQAQVIALESFEGTISSAYSLSGGINPNVYTLSPTSCDGIKAVGGFLDGSANTASKTMDLVYTKPANVTSNGDNITVSISLITIKNPEDTTAAIGGVITLDYSIDNGVTYTNFTTKNLNPAGDGCTEVAGTIPALSNVQNLKIRVRTVATSGAKYKFANFFDSFDIIQNTTVPPTCTNVDVPANGATNVSLRPTLSWPVSQGAFAYLLSLGTTPGDDDILSESVNTKYFNVGKKKTLPANTKIYAQIISVNNVGATPSCEDVYFTTGANQAAPYCGPLIGEATYPITNVNFAGINNSSNASINVGEAHEFFLNTKATVKKGTTYPITLSGTGEGNNRFGYTVYIDWNQNGSFLDAGEAYFKTSDFAGGSGATVTVNKNIAVPATAKLGDTRMRVKYNFNASATETGDELSPCLDMTYGQTEDYTVTVINDLATNEANKTFAIVYPNPFSDVLKISDAKNVASIIITDISGRTVKTLAPASELKLDDLKKGVYLVTVKLNNGTSTTTKVIKE